jgi:hypothetical protein
LIKKESHTLKALKTGIILFLIVATANSLFFGVSEYNIQKENILHEMRNSLYITRDQFSEAIWKNRKDDIDELSRNLLKNRHITGIKIINHSNNFVEIDKIKHERGNSFIESRELTFQYSGKKVKIAKIEVFSDFEAVFDRSFDTILLLVFKTIIETIAITFILLWSFKNLFAKYILAVREKVNKGDLSNDLEHKSNLVAIEEKFQTILSHLIEIYQNKADIVDIEKKKEAPSPVIDEVKPKSTASADQLSQILNFANPSKDVYNHFFKSTFFATQSVRNDSGDVILFSEIEKNKELLLFLVDYSNADDITSLQIILALKDIEKDIVMKYNLNNKLFSTSKIIEFMDQKIRSRMIENEIYGAKQAEFNGLVMYINLENNKIEYTSKNVLIFEHDGKDFTLYDDNGLFNGRTSTSKQSGYQEQIIGIESGFSYYIVTDGFAEQTKGNSGTNIGRDALIQTLKDVQNLDFTAQAHPIVSTFNKLKGDRPQDDDMSVIGFSL